MKQLLPEKMEPKSKRDRRSGGVRQRATLERSNNNKEIQSKKQHSKSRDGLGNTARRGFKGKMDYEWEKINLLCHLKVGHKNPVIARRQRT